MSQPMVAPVRNGWAVPAFVLGLVSWVGALLIGIRFSGLDAVFLGAVPVLLGGLACIFGIIGVVIGAQRRRGIVLSGVAIAFGALAFAALFFGRWLGESFFGFPYQG